MIEFGHEINAVYEALDKDYGLRIKAQVKGSGLSFDRLAEGHHPQLGVPCRLLVLNGMKIHFVGRSDLLGGIRNAVAFRLRAVQEEAADLQYHQAHDRVVDEERMFYALDGLGHQEHKLSKLLMVLDRLKAKRA